MRQTIKLFLFCISIFFMACSSSKILKMNTYEQGSKITYTLNVPSGATSKIIEDQHYKETQLFYKDGSIFYITDDDKSGGAINKEKITEYGEDILLKIVTSDTLDIGGLSTNGYWRERKMNHIVIGYLNASESRKREFDQAIKSMKKQ